MYDTIYDKDLVNVETAIKLAYTNDKHNNFTNAADIYDDEADTTIIETNVVVIKVSFASI